MTEHRLPKLIIPILFFLSAIILTFASFSKLPYLGALYDTLVKILPGYRPCPAVAFCVPNTAEAALFFSLVIAHTVVIYLLLLILYKRISKSGAKGK